MSQAKELELEKDISYHLRMMQQLLSSGTMDENDIRNVDETHFTTNMDN